MKSTWLSLPVVFLTLCAVASGAVAVDAAPGRAVTFSAPTGLQVQTPEEGVWSIACDWRDGRPAEWRHAPAASATRTGEWLVVKGTMEACGGVWVLEDAYRLQYVGNGLPLVEGRRRWEWKGQQPAPRVTLSVRLRVAALRHTALLPGILYYGNPSGERSDRMPFHEAGKPVGQAGGRVPFYHGAPGEEALFEEHRFPMPFAYVEAASGDKLVGATLLTAPSPVPYGNLADQWWSLGVKGAVDGAELTVLSGYCAANGKTSVIKATQRDFLPYDDAWLNVPPGAVIEKRFYVDVFRVTSPGSGFQLAVKSALALFTPFALDGFPSMEEIVRAKYRYAKSRWHEEAGAAGFKKYEARDYFVMGWTGQAEAPGYALQVLARGLQDPQALDMARRSVDFLVQAEFYAGGFRNWYDYRNRKWSGEEIVNQGQAMLAIARALKLARSRGWDVRAWEQFLKRAAGIHSARILAPDWRPASTAEAAFVAPLFLCAELLDEPVFRQAAVKAAEHYGRRHVSMQEPYWGGTNDARCEDKEAAALALEAFLALYEHTRQPEHLAWARHAADVTLTYMFVWDVDLPPGRLRDHNFKTRGWTVVSPQNQHIDVWGVLIAPDLYRLGVLQQDEDLRKAALLMYRTCGQMIDPNGSQGEQMHHTNWPRMNQPGAAWGGRGGYNESWTVFWITAHFLTAAARFEELGVPVFAPAPQH